MESGKFKVNGQRLKAVPPVEYIIPVPSQKEKTVHIYTYRCELIFHSYIYRYSRTSKHRNVRRLTLFVYIQEGEIFQEHKTNENLNVPKRMKRSIEEILVLYDKSNQGKTNTLRALIEELTGSLPNEKGDIRVVIPNYRVKKPTQKINIFVTTYGDAPFIIEDNIRFFDGKMPDTLTVPMFIFENGAWMPIESPKQLTTYDANICISACRSDGVGA